MGCRIAIAIWLLATVCAAGQDSVPATQNPPAGKEIYYFEPDVQAPEFLASTEPLTPISHCKKIEGIVVLTAVVEPSGVANHLGLLRSASESLDHLALSYAESLRFKPGMQNGVPAPVAVELEFILKACAQQTTEIGGDPTRAVLRSQPEKILELQPDPRRGKSSAGGTSAETAAGPGSNGHDPTTSPPIPLNPLPLGSAFSDAVHRAKMGGTCLVKVTVNARGLPESPILVKGVDPILDQVALKSVLQWRFQPAKKAGKPVPMQITVAVPFRSY